MLKKLKKSSMYRSKKFQYIGAFIIILLTATIGVYMLKGSHASSPSVTLNADKGTLTNGATTQSDTNASDGKYVQFGSVTPSITKMIGLNGTFTDSQYDFVKDAENMGAQWERVEQWGDSAGYFTVPQAIAALTKDNMHMLPLVSDYGTSWVTAAGKQQWVNQVVHTATTYAQGGTFWQGKTDYGSPVVEVANEAWNQYYNWPDNGWQNPGEYAKMLSQAASAVNTATNGRIKLLASVIPNYTASDGKSHDWSKDMQAAVPGLAGQLGGVVEHPYGDIVITSSNPANSISICGSSTCSTNPNFQYPENLNTIHTDWPNTPVYVTEVGQKAQTTVANGQTQSCANTNGNDQVGCTNQCKAMNIYFDDFRKNSWEAALFWFNQKDYQNYVSKSQGGDNGWALIDNAAVTSTSPGTRKPAWNAYQMQATKQTDYPC